MEISGFSNRFAKPTAYLQESSNLELDECIHDQWRNIWYVHPRNVVMIQKELEAAGNNVILGVPHHNKIESSPIGFGWVRP